MPASTGGPVSTPSVIEERVVDDRRAGSRRAPATRGRRRAGRRATGTSPGPRTASACAGSVRGSAPGLVPRAAALRAGVVVGPGERSSALQGERVEDGVDLVVVCSSKHSSEHRIRTRWTRLPPASKKASTSRDHRSRRPPASVPASRCTPVVAEVDLLVRSRSAIVVLNSSGSRRAVVERGQPSERRATRSTGSRPAVEQQDGGVALRVRRLAWLGVLAVGRGGSLGAVDEHAPRGRSRVERVAAGTCAARSSTGEGPQSAGQPQEQRRSPRSST